MGEGDVRRGDTRGTALRYVPRDSAESEFGAEAAVVNNPLREGCAQRFGDWVEEQKTRFAESRRLRYEYRNGGRGAEPRCVRDCSGWLLLACELAATSIATHGSATAWRGRFLGGTTARTQVEPVSWIVPQ